MIKTWTSGAAEDEACKNCGAVYEITIQRLPAKDSDHFNCEVCGTLLRKWNDTRVPNFKLRVNGRETEGSAE